MKRFPIKWSNMDTYILRNTAMHHMQYETPYPGVSLFPNRGAEKIDTPLSTSCMVHLTAITPSGQNPSEEPHGR